MNEELLLGCFEKLRSNAASGIDNVTKQDYAQHLDANLSNLVNRLHQMAYRPQAVLRVYIPKPGSDKRRPLGVPALEDKLVQAGLVKILQAIYEKDFIEDSYGFRPRRSCHDALRALSQTVENAPINFIVEADIKGFFDNVDQEHLMAFLEHRIADPRILRLIRRFLKAGIQEEGTFRASESGVPQGGTISPLLANITLHYVLDLWFTRRFIKTCTGTARLIRYADDFVTCFQTEADATRFRKEMEERLNQFGLEIAKDKTRQIEFGPFAVQRAQARGTRAETFDFLGFTHYCSRTRDGKRFRMKRKTIGKRFGAKLLIYKEWLKSNRTLSTPDIMKKTAAKLRGHYGYYGVTDNAKCIGSYFHEVKGILYKWLNRRGKVGCYNWEKFKKLLKKFPLPYPRTMVNMF
jgi:group II intron reverse transcriptase/maturase